MYSTAYGRIMKTQNIEQLLTMRPSHPTNQMEYCVATMHIV